MDKITIKGKILQKIENLREIKKVNKEYLIDMETEEGTQRFVAKKTDEKVTPEGFKIERFLLTPVE